MFQILQTNLLVINQKYFYNKLYRKMFVKASQALRQYPALNKAWLPMFTYKFYLSYLILPLPNSNRTLILTTKQTRKRNQQSIIRQLHYFVQGQKAFQAGTIPPYPPTLVMSKERLYIYLLGL